MSIASIINRVRELPLLTESTFGELCRQATGVREKFPAADTDISTTHIVDLLRFGCLLAFPDRGSALAIAISAAEIEDENTRYRQATDRADLWQYGFPSAIPGAFHTCEGFLPTLKVAPRSIFELFVQREAYVLVDRKGEASGLYYPMFTPDCCYREEDLRSGEYVDGSPDPKRAAI